MIITKVSKYDPCALFTARTNSEMSVSYSGIEEVRLNHDQPTLLCHLQVVDIDPATTVKVEILDYQVSDGVVDLFLVEELELTSLGVVRKIAGPITSKVLVRLTVTGGSSSLNFTIVPGDFRDDTVELTLEELTGKFSISGLNNGGLFTEVPVNSTTWVALPLTALTDRNSIGIQNQSTVEMKLNFAQPVGYEGWILKQNSAKFYDIKENIIVYAKTKTGTGIIGIEEIS